MKEEIINLYSKVATKNDFIFELSQVVDRAPNTIRTHWFSKANFYSIPLELQRTVRDFAVEYLENQKATV